MRVEWIGGNRVGRTNRLIHLPEKSEGTEHYVTQ